MNLFQWLKHALGGEVKMSRGREECKREFRLEEVFEIIVLIHEMGRDIMSALSDLQAAVAASTGMDGNAIATINALVAQVTDLKAQLAAAQSASGTADADLLPLTTALGASTTALGAAIPAPVVVPPVDVPPVDVPPVA